jgi:Ni/Co efflux regulator RcnB
MKKLLVISLIAGSLIAAPTASHAAVKSPKPAVKVAGGEGSAEHEAGEGKSVEKKETGGKTKKKVIKKKK